MARPPGIEGIAIAAVQVTAGQADKNRGNSHISRLPLDAVINLDYVHAELFTTWFLAGIIHE
jgi:hypothetical protein